MRKKKILITGLVLCMIMGLVNLVAAQVSVTVSPDRTTANLGDTITFTVTETMTVAATIDHRLCNIDSLFTGESCEEVATTAGTDSPHCIANGFDGIFKVTLPSAPFAAGTYRIDFSSQDVVSGHGSSTGVDIIVDAAGSVTIQPQAPAPSGPSAPTPGPSAPTALDEIKSKIAMAACNILNILITIVGVVALLFIVLSGIKYMTSADDPSARNEAKGRFIWAVIGLFIVLIACPLVDFLSIDPLIPGFCGRCGEFGVYIPTPGTTPGEPGTLGFIGFSIDPSKIVIENGGKIEANKVKLTAQLKDKNGKNLDEPNVNLKLRYDIGAGWNDGVDPFMPPTDGSGKSEVSVPSGDFTVNLPGPELSDLVKEMKSIVPIFGIPDSCITEDTIKSHLSDGSISVMLRVKENGNYGKSNGISFTIDFSDLAKHIKPVAIIKSIGGKSWVELKAEPQPPHVDQDERGNVRFVGDAAGGSGDYPIIEWKEGATVLKTGKSVDIDLDEGVHEIKFYIEDSNGNSDEETLQINVTKYNHPPEIDGISILNTHYEIIDDPEEGQVVYLDCGIEDDSLGPPYTYEWTVYSEVLGENLEIDKPGPRYRLTNGFFAGDNKITVKVQDAGGKWSKEETRTITVEPEGFISSCIAVEEYGEYYRNCPHPDISTGCNVIDKPNQLLVGFSGESCSSTSYKKEWLEYEWDFGDGSETQGIGDVTHKYISKGDYTVTLTVSIDRDGMYMEDKSSVNIKIREDDSHYYVGFVSV